MFDIIILQYIWWGLMITLLIGFTITDGFDMGVAILLPFIAKSDIQRRVVINTIGATWEGNQVWLITAIAGLLASFPKVYATIFSSLYIIAFLVLFCLFLRPVGFDYRSKLTNPTWRQCWDIGLFIGGFIPSFLFGVILGNMFLGFPFYFDKWQVLFNDVSFFDLFSPFAILIGCMSSTFLALHGANWLNLKADGIIRQRARKISKYLALLFIILWLTGGYSLMHINGFSLFNNQITMYKGAWLNNFIQHKNLFLFIPITILSIMVNLFLQKKSPFLAWIQSVITIFLVFITTAIAYFPFMLPSSLDVSQSLTLYNASSSYKTLNSMLIAVIIFLPLILLYTSWVYKVLKGRISEDKIHNSKSYWY